MQVIERSSVTLAARAGNFRGGQDFVGNAVTGEGGQCDVWDFCTAAVEEIEAWEKDRKTSCFRDEDETTLARVKTRPILQEFVWGALGRTRNRCANCAGSSDSVMHRQFLDLNLVLRIILILPSPVVWNVSSLWVDPVSIPNDKSNVLSSG